MSLTENLSTAVAASLEAPLPPAPEGEVFTAEQWDVLFSLLEVFLPSISRDNTDPAEIDDAVARLKRYLPETDAPEDLARRYLSEDPVSSPEFREFVRRKFQLYVPPHDAKGLGFILWTLTTTVGSYMMTGSSVAIHKQPLSTRSRIVCGWATSRVGVLRAIFRSMNGLARQSWVATSHQLGRVLDCPEVPKQLERRTGYDFQFHDFESSQTPATLTADVVIVGSGCGAGVTASHLSRAGMKVLVLEKGWHFSSAHFPMKTGAAGEHLMENGGTLMSDDNSILVMAGSTFGGGGTVNWSASLQPPRAVREEWAADDMPHFLGEEYQECLDTVCDRMGVARSTDPAAMGQIEHNFANRTLLEGSRRLGLTVQTVPQNTASRRHFCGSCTYGCASATKQGPANCWFPDAARHGAEFVEGAWVEEVLLENSKATGVKGVWTSRDRKTTRPFTVTAPKVVVCCGTLHSPLLLRRSGLTNTHIGANLHLHPTAMVWAVWPQRTNPWEGSILTVAMTGLDNQDGHHHGPKVEVICSTPGFGLLSLPFRTTNTGGLSSALEYRVNAVKHSHSTGFVCITRDCDTGKVYADPKDPTGRRVKVAYTPSARDLDHILTGQIAGARIVFAMGAEEIDVSHPRSVRWKRPSSVDPLATPDIDRLSFEGWLESVHSLGLTTPDPCIVGSAHQMGTCRMASSPRTGVVDPSGKVFDTRGLYVADASVFPTASGVNPMVSTMAIAEWISRGIVKEVKAGR